MLVASTVEANSTFNKFWKEKFLPEDVDPDSRTPSENRGAGSVTSMARTSRRSAMSMALPFTSISRPSISRRTTLRTIPTKPKPRFGKVSPRLESTRARMARPSRIRSRTTRFRPPIRARSSGPQQD